MNLFVNFAPDLLLFFIRVVLGIVMIYYGLPKIKSLRKNAEDFVDMGLRPGFFWGTIVAATEFFGGIIVILGFYAEVAAALFGIVMALGVLWKMKKRKPFTDYSYDLLLLALSAVILVFGAGLYTIL
jgi:putative oxidoreductase